MTLSTELESTGDSCDRMDPKSPDLYSHLNHPPLQAQIQKQYESHRVNRNAQQKAKILADDFPGWSLDEVLRRLDGSAKEEGYVDPRNCLVFWARPPPHIREVVAFVQKELREVAPGKIYEPVLPFPRRSKKKKKTNKQTNKCEFSEQRRS